MLLLPRTRYQHLARSVLNASHGLRISGDGQRGHLPPRNMALVGLGAVDARPPEQVMFGASIGIPLPETLEEMHSDMLRGGVLAHRDLCLGCDLKRNIHPGGADVMTPA